MSFVWGCVEIIVVNFIFEAHMVAASNTVMCPQTFAAGRTCTAYSSNTVKITSFRFNTYTQLDL